MHQYARGDRVRIDIPDETHPHHELHSEHGVVLDVVDESRIVRVGLEDLWITFDAHSCELRPPIE